MHWKMSNPGDLPKTQPPVRPKTRNQGLFLRSTFTNFESCKTVLGQLSLTNHALKFILPYEIMTKYSKHFEITKYLSISWIYKHSFTMISHNRNKPSIWTHRCMLPRAPMESVVLIRAYNMRSIQIHPAFYNHASTGINRWDCMNVRYI